MVHAKNHSTWEAKAGKLLAWAIWQKPALKETDNFYLCSAFHIYSPFLHNFVFASHGVGFHSQSTPADQARKALYNDQGLFYFHSPR